MRSVTPNFSANAASPMSAMYSARFMSRDVNTFCVNTQGVDPTPCTWTAELASRHAQSVPKKKGKSLPDAEKKQKVTPEGLLAGQRIVAARNAKGWSQDRLHQEAITRIGPGKLGARQVGNWEQGTRQPGIRESKYLAEVLDEPAAFLLGLVDETDRQLLKLDLALKEALLKTIAAVPVQTAVTPQQEQKKPTEGRPIEKSPLPAPLRRSSGA